MSTSCSLGQVQGQVQKAGWAFGGTAQFPLLPACVSARVAGAWPAGTRRTGAWLPAAPQVCGDGNGVEGDAVVPLCSALLDGAEHIVLDGVLHSMSRIRTFDEKSNEEWYGSETVVDTWLHHLL
jgi:hypothetical protein